MMWLIPIVPLVVWVGWLHWRLYLTRRDLWAALESLRVWQEAGKSLQRQLQKVDKNNRLLVKVARQTSARHRKFKAQIMHLFRGVVQTVSLMADALGIDLPQEAEIARTSDGDRRPSPPIEKHDD
jgi:hypothetical protein